MSNSIITFADHTAKVELRMFVDDLTHHIQQKYRIKIVDFSSTNSNGTLALQIYLNERFYLVQKNNKILFEIENVSLSEDGMALELQLTSAQTIDTKKELQLKNTILFDVFKKQKNMVRLKRKNNEYRIFSSTIDNPILSLQ